MLPPPRDEVDEMLQAQLRRIARTLGKSMERVTAARRDSRAGAQEVWETRGRIAGHLGACAQGHDDE